MGRKTNTDTTPATVDAPAAPKASPNATDDALTAAAIVNAQLDADNPAPAMAPPTAAGMAPHEAKRLSGLKRDAATRIRCNTGGFNHKRGASRPRFQLIVDAGDEGLTIAEYVAAGGRRADVPWDLKREVITVEGDGASHYAALALTSR